jgi:tRNA pseudouridine65 synthase
MHCEQPKLPESLTEPVFVEEIPPSLPVLYQDEHLVAVYKPPGLLVHRSWLDKEATQFAMQMVRDQLGQHVYPVHRLDRPTAGLLLFALNRETAALMMPLFAQHQIEKGYLAIVRGHIEGEHHLDYPLKEELDKVADKFSDPNREAQPAVTDYQALAQTEIPYSTGRYSTSRYSLLALKPLTGRKHQLRRHMHHISHPMIGDTTHGDGRHNKLFRQLDMPGLWLLAHQMAFIHPVSGQNVTITCPLPKRWMDALERLAIDVPRV